MSPTRRSGTVGRLWLARPEGCVRLSPRASRSSEEGRWRLDVLSLSLRGAVRRARVSAALPEGGVASAFARGRVRQGSEEPLCPWPAAQDQACLGIVLHLRRVETEDLVGPSAEAGGSSWPCPSARPATEVLGPPSPPRWVGRVSVPASRDRREVAGAEAPRPQAEALGRHGFQVRRPFFRGPGTPFIADSRGCHCRSGETLYCSSRGSGRLGSDED